MRLDDTGIVSDHDLLLDVGPNDHHDQAESWTVQLDGVTASPGTYEARIALATGNHKTVLGVLRGQQIVDIRGHVGAVLVGSDSSANSMGISIQPYGGSYTTSYLGAYSRLHGDASLAWSGTFGAYITLMDFYLDGDEVVIEFYNSSGSDQYIYCYGTGVAK